MKSCKIDGCEKPSRNLGWCQMHYKRFRRHGDPLKGARSVDRGALSPDATSLITQKDSATSTGITTEGTEAPTRA